MTKRVFAAAFSVVLIAGCAASGSGQGVALMPSTMRGASARLAAPTRTLTSAGANGMVVLRVTVPKRFRTYRARYVSEATKGMAMIFAASSEKPLAFDLTPSSSQCTGSPLFCKIRFRLPATTYSATVKLYDKAPVDGSIPADAHELSIAQDVDFTVKAHAFNNVPLALAGIPASITFGRMPKGTAGTAFATPRIFRVKVRDAAGALIVGPYDEPVRLSDSDASGATSIETSGKGDAAGQLLGSDDTAALRYTGLAVAPVTLTASASGTSSAKVTFAPSLQPIVLAGASSGTPTVWLKPNQTQVRFSATESGWTNAPYDKKLTATAANSCATIATISPSQGTSFTATAVGSPAVGSCPVTLSDFSGGSTLAVTMGYSPTPTLTSLSSWTAQAGTTVTETLTGTGFVTGLTTVGIAGSGVTVSGVTVTSSTSLTASFSVASGASFGPQNVTIATPAGTTSALPLTITTGQQLVVTSNADTGTNTLRSAIAQANSDGGGDRITFNCGSPCFIELGSPLPPILQNMAIDGGANGDVVIDGNLQYRSFFANAGTVTLAALSIQDVLAQGGSGGGGYPTAGGGGLGAGAGLFVNAATAVVAGDTFVDNAAVGGAGGLGVAASSAGGGGGGGAGMVYAGGSGAALGGSAAGGGGGGGGMLLAGAAAAGPNAGGDGGDGGGGGGGTWEATASATTPPGSGGAGYAGNPPGEPGSNPPNAGQGGAGGFGGGGGGGADEGTGGAGGFGGGGGAVGSLVVTGGQGGPGGGGGAGYPGGPGGQLTASVYGGKGGGTQVSDVAAGGGGGAAAGPAVFVNSGTLTTAVSTATNATSTQGSAGNGNATAGTADSTPVFNYKGVVNGSSTAGPVASAMPELSGCARHVGKPVSSKISRRRIRRDC
jgi:hypothetical protein